MINRLALSVEGESDFFGENHFIATFANIFGPVA
jgi:hypothetical protein